MYLFYFLVVACCFDCKCLDLACGHRYTIQLQLFLVYFLAIEDESFDCSIIDKSAMLSCVA